MRATARKDFKGIIRSKIELNANLLKDNASAKDKSRDNAVDLDKKEESIDEAKVLQEELIKKFRKAAK